MRGFCARQTGAFQPVAGLFPADPMGMVLAAPFLALEFGRGAAYNWALLVQLWLACLAGWALCRRFGSGLVGGVAFGVSPYLVGQMLGGEAETLAVWPLAIVAVLLEGAKRWQWALAGLVAAVGAVACWYHGVFIATYMLLWLMVRPVGGRRSHFWSRFRHKLIAPACFAGFVLAPALMLWRALQQPDEMFRAPSLLRYMEEYPKALAAMVSDPAGWLGAPVAGAAHTDLLGWGIVVLSVCGVWELASGGQPAAS